MNNIIPNSHPAPRLPRFAPAPSRVRFGPRLTSVRGFSTIEMLIVVGISLVLMAASVPIVWGTIQNYRFRSSVSGAVGAIRAARFQSIMRGQPTAIVLEPDGNTYQVFTRPPGGDFTAITGEIPLGLMTLPQRTRLEFRPNGTVLATEGTLTLAVSHGERYKTITISNFGNVNVTP